MCVCTRVELLTIALPTHPSLPQSMPHARKYIEDKLRKSDLSLKDSVGRRRRWQRYDSKHEGNKWRGRIVTLTSQIPFTGVVGNYRHTLYTCWSTEAACNLCKCVVFHYSSKKRRNQLRERVHIRPVENPECSVTVNISSFPVQIFLVRRFALVASGVVASVSMGEEDIHLCNTLISVMQGQ